MAITTGKVRASYVSIFQPSTPQGGGEPKYSMSLLIPKSDTATFPQGVRQPCMTETGYNRPECPSGKNAGGIWC